MCFLIIFSVGNNKTAHEDSYLVNFQKVGNLNGKMSWIKRELKKKNTYLIPPPLDNHAHIETKQNTIRTVANEYRALYRSKKYLAVSAVINGDGVAPVGYVDMGVVAVLYLKLLSIY